jgi:hypothetical protein
LPQKHLQKNVRRAMLKSIPIEKKKISGGNQRHRKAGLAVDRPFFSMT